MEPDMSQFPHLGHIKDEPADGQELARESCLPAKPLEPTFWHHLPRPGGLAQTLSASFHDRQEIATAGNANQAALDETPSLLSHSSPLNGNTFHVPAFRYIEEWARAGEQQMSSAPMLPMMQARPEDRHMRNYSLQNPYMSLDRYYGHSTIAPLQNPSRQPGQYDLPHFSSQGNAYAVDNGHAYPPNMVASHMLASSTLDPSKLLPRQIPMSAVRAESVSESDGEMDCADVSDCDWDHQVDHGKDNGWESHPDTICLDKPKFNDTKAKGDMRDAAGVRVTAKIVAIFVLKRDVARQEMWLILYRRNYFGIQGSYTLVCLPESTSDEMLYLHLPNHERIPIQGLYMCMRGVMDTEEGPEIKIVVFNAKRKPLHQGRDPPPIEPQRMKPLKEGSSNYFSASTGPRENNMTVPMNHTFHRNQFRAATQNNGARRTDQQVYHILLELKAEVVVDGVTKLVTVASRMSEPLVVRGRCPLSFQISDQDCDDNDPDLQERESSRGGAVRNKKSSTTQSKKGKAKEASRKSCNKPGSSSRRATRATRASSRLPGLSYGTGSGSNNTALVTPQMFRANGTLNSKTIPQLDDRLRDLAPESWEEG